VPLGLKLWNPIAHRKQHKTLDIVTLFHKAGSPASVRVAELLKQASAKASAGSSSGTREQFELNITEDAPTEDQVRTILEYVGPTGVPSIVKGAQDEKDALKKFKQSRDNLLRPVVCAGSLYPWSSCFTNKCLCRWSTGAMARRSLAITSPKS
jgi:hypothetical protein